MKVRNASGFDFQLPLIIISTPCPFGLEGMTTSIVSACPLRIP